MWIGNAVIPLSCTYRQTGMRASMVVVRWSIFVSCRRGCLAVGRTWVTRTTGTMLKAKPALVCYRSGASGMTIHRSYNCGTGDRPPRHSREAWVCKRSSHSQLSDFGTGLPKVSADILKFSATLRWWLLLSMVCHPGWIVWGRAPIRRRGTRDFGNIG